MSRADEPLEHDSCTKMRRIVERHGTMNVLTGAMLYTSSETVVRPCGAPLFTDAERTSGLCSACAAGWTHRDNRPATAHEIEGAA